MFKIQDVRDAFFAFVCEYESAADKITPEQQAIYGVEIYNPDTNQLDHEATQKARQIEIDRLHHGQIIMEKAQLVMSEPSNNNSIITLISNDAPTIFVTSGYEANVELYRQVTLVIDINYLTPAEISQITETAESTWRNKASNGEIPGAIKKGKQWLLPVSSIRNLGINIKSDHFL
jgi:hypothetical protein